MKRCSFFLSAAAVMLAWGMTAPAAHGGTVPLSTLIGTTQTVDGFNFTFISYVPNPNAPAASAINVSFFPPPPSGGEVGFTLFGSFGAAAGVSSDGDLRYSVSTVSGAPITDALLVANPNVGPNNPGGMSGVTETFQAGSFTGPVIGSLSVQGSPGSASAPPPDFPPGAIFVDKDIESIGGANGVSLSTITQAFSTTIPEPTSIALLGIGMTGFLAFRRLFKRTSVA
jgi:hypothetical protein